jgi:hypothetical protein
VKKEWIASSQGLLAMTVIPKYDFAFSRRVAPEAPITSGLGLICRTRAA